MPSQFLSLNDRFDPEDENDQDEVVKLATALDEVEGRPVQQRSADSVNQLEVAEETVAFQKRSGLKPDGVVRPKGPTATRIAADQVARRSGPKPRHRQALGRGANLPLWGAVGPGRDSLPRDRRAISNALTLAGYKPKLPGSGPGSQDDDLSRQVDKATTVALKRFQASHGLQADGVARPFGPTHDMLDHVIAPRLEKLVGPDPTRPKPFEKPEPKYVGRKVPLRPMMIRSHLQDDEDLDNEVEYQAAVDLGQMIRDDMAFMEASISPVDGEDADDRAELEAKDDPGRNADRPKAAEEETKPAPLYHNNAGSPIERAQSFLKTRRFADLRENPGLQAKVSAEQAEHFSGKPTAAVEAGLIGAARQARRPSTPHEPRPSGDPQRGGLYPRLVVARMELLAARYRGENPDLPEEEINRKVLEKTAYGLGLPNDEARLLLDFSPYVGPVLTFMDVAELADGVYEMIKDGQLNPEIIMLAAAMTPGVGKSAKRSKSGPDADTRKDGPESGRPDEAADASDSRPDQKEKRENDQSEEIAVSEEYAIGKLVEYQEVDIKSVSSFGPARSFGPENWRALPLDVRKSLRGVLPHVIKRNTEDWGYLIAQAAGSIDDLPRGILKRVMIVGPDGGVRHFDAFLVGRAQRNPSTGKPEIVDMESTAAAEFKGARSQKTRNQKRLDDMINNGAVTVLLPARGNERYYPVKISSEVIDLRIPLSDVPEEKLIKDLINEFRRIDVPEEVQASMISTFKNGLEIERQLRAAGYDNLASQISVGMALGVLVLPYDESEKQEQIEF